MEKRLYKISLYILSKKETTQTKLQTTLEKSCEIYLIKYVEEKLTDDFYRIHNSYIVNLKKIQEFIKNEESVVLSNKIKIPVSRRRKADFLKKFI